MKMSRVVVAVLAAASLYSAPVVAQEADQAPDDHGALVSFQCATIYHEGRPYQLCRAEYEDGYVRWSGQPLLIA